MEQRLLTCKEVKSIENDMLIYFKDFCKCYNLKFCLAYGTLLGAARHRGFIPWDDDIDVFMPRNDYENLYRLFQDGKIDKKYTINCYRDKSSYHPHFKFVNKDTVCRESYIDPRFSIGLWIDIFPLDSFCMESKADARTVSLSSAKNGILRQLLGLSVGDPGNGASSMAKTTKRILLPLSRMLDPIAIARAIDESAKRISDQRRGKVVTHFVAMTESSASDTQVFANTVLCPFSELVFEGAIYPVPGNYEAFLSQNYGDWKALPPESERHLHFTTAYAKANECSNVK